MTKKKSANALISDLKRKTRKKYSSEEKIEFDGEKYRTNSYNKVLEWIFQNTNDLQNKKTEDADQKSVSSVSVPGAGVEPARP